MGGVDSDVPIFFWTFSCLFFLTHTQHGLHLPNAVPTSYLASVHSCPPWNFSRHETLLNLSRVIFNHPIFLRGDKERFSFFFFFFWISQEECVYINVTIMCTLYVQQKFMASSHVGNIQMTWYHGMNGLKILLSEFFLLFNSEILKTGKLIIKIKIMVTI